MRVFVTDGIGRSRSYIIPELIAAGHEVTALARSDMAAARVAALGAEVRRGDIQDLSSLREAAADSDGAGQVATQAWSREKRATALVRPLVRSSVENG